MAALVRVGELGIGGCNEPAASEIVIPYVSRAVGRPLIARTVNNNAYDTDVLVRQRGVKRGNRNVAVGEGDALSPRDQFQKQWLVAKGENALVGACQKLRDIRPAYNARMGPLDYSRRVAVVYIGRVGNEPRAAEYPADITNANARAMAGGKLLSRQNYRLSGQPPLTDGGRHQDKREERYRDRSGCRPIISRERKVDGVHVLIILAAMAAISCLYAGLFFHFVMGPRR